MTLTAVTLVLCPHCLDGCRSHPVLPAHRCRTEGCALYDAMVPYEGLRGAVAEQLTCARCRRAIVAEAGDETYECLRCSSTGLCVSCMADCCMVVPR
jgi:hypothetical protein